MLDSVLTIPKIYVVLTHDFPPFDYINPSADFYDTVTAKNEFVFEGLTFGADDRILTLSTCLHRYDTQNTRNHRLVVMAKLIPSDAVIQEVLITANPNPQRP